ncbi:hypothetical protein BGW80DRAFT_1288687 [Lactifluus volemus]|nr:hypothetical protein BGW80DRAFT_1288687 [Lactifluus volemus]
MYGRLHRQSPPYIWCFFCIYLFYVNRPSATNSSPFSHPSANSVALFAFSTLLTVGVNLVSHRDIPSALSRRPPLSRPCLRGLVNRLVNTDDLAWRSGFRLPLSCAFVTPSPSPQSCYFEGNVVIVTRQHHLLVDPVTIFID